MKSIQDKLIYKQHSLKFIEHVCFIATDLLYNLQIIIMGFCATYCERRKKFKIFSCSQRSCFLVLATYLRIKMKALVNIRPIRGGYVNARSKHVFSFTLIKTWKNRC